MRKAAHILTVALTMLVAYSAADAQKGRRGKEGDTANEGGGGSTTATATEVIKDVYDAAVSFVTAVAMEVAKQMPDLSSSAEEKAAWHAQTKSLETLRSTYQTQSDILGGMLRRGITAMDDWESPVAIMDGAWNTYLAESRRSQIVSPRDAASGLPQIMKQRNEVVVKSFTEFELPTFLKAARKRK